MLAASTLRAVRSAMPPLGSFRSVCSMRKEVLPSLVRVHDSASPLRPGSAIAAPNSHLRQPIGARTFRSAAVCRDSKKGGPDRVGPAEADRRRAPKPASTAGDDSAAKAPSDNARGVSKTDKSKDDSKGGLQELKRILSLARPEAGMIAGAVALLFVSSGVTMSIPWGLGKALDVVSAPGVDLPATLSGLYPIVAGVFVLGAAANAGRVFLIQFAGSRIVARLRSTFYADLLSRPLAYHDKERTGELVSRLSTDVAIMSRTVTQNVSDGLRSTVTSVAGTVLLFTISPKLCLIMISVLPPLAIAARLYGRFVRSLSKRTQEALAHAVEEAEEKLSSLRTVRLFGREKTEEGRFNARIGQVLRLAKTESLASATFFGMAGMSGNFTVLAVLYFGSSMVHSGAITVGELTSFLLYTAYVGGSLVGIGGVYTDLMRGLGASTRVFGILDSREPPPIGSLPIPGGQSAALTSTTSIDGLRPSLGGRISFRNVVFTYPTRSGHVFSNLSFDCAPGTVTGIAGPSGSGKSTILSLLLRLYDPEAGSIEVDGYDLRVLDPTWFRSDVAAVVSQEPTLWAGSIEENIRYGRPDATQEEVREAAAAANCLEFIEGFPDRWETKLGERGVDLSGGQRQRIAIARAILKNPKILVLDEASSNLDPVSERLVQVALERVMRGRTVLVIAHRLSTIRNADQILLVRDGGVAERGTYDELIARGGAFASLAAGQEAARRAVEM